MTWWRRLSIRQKLVGIVAMITVSALVVAFGVILARDVRAFQQEAVESATFFARVVGQYAVPELAFLDAVSARETLSNLDVVPHVEGAFLFDPEGELFASWGVGTAVPTDLTTGVGIDVHGIRVTEPIQHRGERFGTIVLRVSTDPLKVRVRRHLFVLLVTLVVVVALAVLAAYLLQRPISGPILDLAAAMRRVSLTGDYSMRLEHEARDEIGTLYTGFNEMMAKVLARERERDQAELRTQEKSRFLANMSHELRTPLNSIIGFSEVLLGQSDRFDEKQARFLDHIHTSGQHLLSLINEILDLSKVEAGRVDLHPEPIGLESLLEGVAAVMRGHAGQRGITIRFELAQSLPVVLVDPVKVKQVFYNLLSNAVKFSPDNAEVVVAARALDLEESPLGEASVEVAVRDDGIGIAEADRDRIFAEFVQIDESVGRRFEGTGLGLTLVRAFVEMHDGKVWVESILDHGSTFYVVLPTRYQPARGHSGSSDTVVVVADGDPGSAQRWVRRFGDVQINTYPARSVEAVLGLVRSRRPALVTVVLDGGDELDGWRVLEALERDERTRRVPVAICCLGRDPHVGICLAADAYFTEPLDLDRLRDRIEALLVGSPPEGPILVVDDDAQVHEVLGEHLAPLGHEVIHAWNVREAREELAKRDPALVVVDLFAGRMDGFEVALEAGGSERGDGPPLVVVARREVEDTARRALRRRVSESRFAGPIEQVMVSSVLGLVRRTTSNLPVITNVARGGATAPPD